MSTYYKITYMSASRIKQRRKELKLTQAQVGAHLGLSASAITQWERGVTRPNGENLLRLAQILKTTPHWITTGKGNENAVPAPRPEYAVPLISWVNAGAWCDSPDNYAPGDAEEWLPKPHNAGPHTFALKVINDSMESPYPGQRTYPGGTIIYVDPDKPVENGSRVVARTGGEYTFKTYVEDAGRKYLKPINPSYDKIDITEDVHICGVVIGSYLPE